MNPLKYAQHYIGRNTNLLNEYNSNFKNFIDDLIFRRIDGSFPSHLFAALVILQSGMYFFI